MMQKKSSTPKLKRERPCLFCVNNTDHVDYKNTKLLQRYISSYGKIVARKRSSVCSFHQRKLSGAIKKARLMALLPFVVN
ncbi:30S ribosomal protein S18 [Candidatus Uhrbacteria bacterium RIFCSPHIGHO2_02_FULL_54_11]|uniref:Small ribosomal subunit protein bS18 n=1 Tax=Candidatus Uhrbacteria bacterium GW2011_GWC2_53_7 TaxID=1618986 RepID=A0A0G1Y058_9BACT|nr:MAG: 30S ribosomal protein S18 [Candidatus Uhrbacteria bacterium GW2011_GWC2_53_7]OGL71181.1 MAG: 30S ribosomal protein S18 [Candidatus Uhrbacteria bacterium RIFCSPHIGHO2_02_FULL_54_11]